MFLGIRIKAERNEEDSLECPKKIILDYGPGA